MKLFFLFYLSVYSLLHLYAYHKVRVAFSPNLATKFLFFFCSLLLILAPLVVRFAEREGMEFFARGLAYICYTWMGLLFLFVVISGVFDLVRLAHFFMARLAPSLRMITLTGKSVFFVQIILTLLLYGYGLLEANTIRLRHIVLESPLIPVYSGTIRIAQISDVHLGLIVRERRAGRILDQVRSAKPDLLISTGDLVDSNMNDISEVGKLFVAIKPRLGKIAILGNHEFYAGLNNSLRFTEQAGFRVLRNEAARVGPLNIVGMDDQRASSFVSAGTGLEKKLLAGRPHDRFTFLLKHRPIIDSASVNHFDLQLSGHTHNGQIFPFNLVTRLSFPYDTGRLVSVGKGFLYVSPGSGTWGPPIRILAPPEVTIIDLVPGRVFRELGRKKGRDLR